MKTVNSFVVLLCLVPMLACSPLENQARDTAAALSGSIIAAQTKYQTMCTANPDEEICRVINHGASAQNALITAIETYCGWNVNVAPPDPQAPCVPVRSAEGALKAAIANAARLTAEIRGAI